MLRTVEPTVSVIIKALNEEKHIAFAIESALIALDGINGEVILADGASSDRTVEIAQQYPIKIVRLNNIRDRSCGAGAQLGYQYSRGNYVCLIDGDMRLHKAFLSAAITYLEENPSVAGVGGIIVEQETTNLEFAQRSGRQDRNRLPGPVPCLYCSGMYRRSAIESVGYLTDRNLHAGEELDLGARLHARGWTLARMAIPSVDHHGHPGSAYRLLLSRMTTRLSLGMGETSQGRDRPPPFLVHHSKRQKPLLVPSGRGVVANDCGQSTCNRRAFICPRGRSASFVSHRGNVRPLALDASRSLLHRSLEHVRAELLSRDHASSRFPRPLDRKHRDRRQRSGKSDRNQSTITPGVFCCWLGGDASCVRAAQSQRLPRTRPAR